jgi:hypothetical protein
MLERQEELLYKGRAKIRDTSRPKIRKNELRNHDKRIQGDEKEIAQRYKKNDWEIWQQTEVRTAAVSSH